MLLMTCTSSLTAQLIHHELLVYAALLVFDGTQRMKQGEAMITGDYWAVLYLTIACCAPGYPC